MAMFAVLLLLAAPLLPPAAAQRPPGCRRQCGNVTVPYPFGIGARCHRGEGRGFRLECDDTRHPPRLTVAGYGHEVVAISLASAEATVLLNASRACYDRTSGSGRVLDRREYPMALNGSAFLFSSMKSKFVAIGCPDLAYFVDDGGYYVTGCMSVCRPSESALPGSCRGGDGCCQSNIPLGLASYRPHVRSFGRRQQQQGGTFLANSTGCAYAFMVDAWWFWYAGSHFNRTGDFAVPVVLDWAIRGAGAGDSCATVRENATAYACRSAQSVCLDSTNGPGYVCNCTSGYEGNPYVLGGCNGTTLARKKIRWTPVANCRSCVPEGICRHLSSRCIRRCAPGVSILGSCALARLPIETFQAHLLDAR
ncbi:unnamed protein product [Triticum turgidum subsp. durum]|uniref:Wall-associated receptor kinase galacturonan-binding domain-containing protein n=1 Tax=Triticum turgidum subsp. durum TaxID=4567 RepID=A0A9R0XC66_TRITD|nr:unnamed protein product [Triticum turgidum subsp. durum]